MTRNDAREIMMQILFEMDSAKTINAENAREEADKLISQKLEGNHVNRGKEIIGAVIDNLEEVDQIINEHSTKWKTSRMPKVDLAVMRLAVGEIKYAEDVPDAVAVNEAINLVKKFSTDNSAKFVHGVLGAVLKA